MRSKQSSRGRRVGKIVGITLVTAVFLELVLQVISYGVYLNHRGTHADDGASNRRRVLCVGDSYTFGRGASDPAFSYPSVLQLRLAEHHDRDVDVVNCGWPSQNSADVLLKLKDQLDRTRPEVLCILIGTNDNWSRPKAVASDESVSTGFPLRWRTARLVQILFQPSSVHAAETQGPAPQQDVPAEARSDADVEIAFEMLRHAGLFPDTIERRKASFTAAQRECLQGLAGLTDPEARIAYIDEHLDAQDRHPRLMSWKAAALAKLGRRDETNALVDELIEREAESSSQELAIAILKGLDLTGRYDELLDYASRFTTAAPRLLEGWQGLAKALFYSDDADVQERALIPFARAVALAPLRVARSPAYKRIGFLLARQKKIEEAALVIGAASILSDDVRKARGKWVSEDVPHEVVESLVERFGTTSFTESRLRALLDYVRPAVVSDSGYLAVYANNVEKMIEMAESYGARVVLVSYPRDASIVPAQQALAEAHGIPFVNCCERFQRELETKTVENLFVADGHCNDAGYAIVAEMVAPVVDRLLED